MSQDDIMKLLEDGKKRTVGEIARTIGHSEWWVRTYLGRLMKWGVIDRDISPGNQGNRSFSYFIGGRTKSEDARRKLRMLAARKTDLAVEIMEIKGEMRKLRRHL